MKKIIGVLFLVIGLLIAVNVLAESDNTAVNVGYVVPVPDTSCQGCIGPGNDSSTLTITNVTQRAGTDSATIGWLASSNYSITSRKFVYGLSTNFGEPVSVSEDRMVLSGLTASTSYFFKIIVTDSLNKVVEYSGNFVTASLESPGRNLLISEVSLLPNSNRAVLSFRISKSATAQVDYSRLDGSLATVLSSEEYTNTKNFQLNNLLANTDYRFRIVATALDGETTSTTYFNFKTLEEVTAPPNVTNLQLQVVNNTISLSWKNPLQSVSPNFIGVRIMRGSAISTHPSMGQVVLESNVESFVDAPVVPGVTLYYTVFSRDNSGNYSSGVAVSGLVPVVNKIEICGNNLDDDGDGRIDCADSDCGSFPSCNVSTPGGGEICSGGLDEDSDGMVDCADADCQTASVCSSNPPGGGTTSEVCGNTLDDDGNGLADCLDVACAGFPACVGEPPIIGVEKECADEVDNDGNGLIDWPADAGCESAEDNSEYSPPIQNISDEEDVALDDLEFYSGGGTVLLTPVANSVVGLAGYDLTVNWWLKSGQKPKAVKFRLGSDVMNVVFNSVDNYYTVKSSFPVGDKSAYFEIDYGMGKIDTVNFDVGGKSWGKVSDNSGVLANVEVSLYGGNGELFDAEKFSQSNPKLTGDEGYYGWMVPKGNFYVVAKRGGYFDYRSSVLNASGNYWAQDIKMIKKPESILESIKSGDSLIQNIGNVSVAALANVVANAQVVKQTIDVYANNPTIEKAAENYAAPITVGVVAVATVPVMSLPGVIALLRFVFLQPFMLIGRKRRKKWGTVYNSLNKLTIDLAIVRLIDRVNGRVVQSRVTDQKGRYYFVAKPGKYRIEVSKDGFVFPTVLLSDMKTDSEKVDLYHGEDVNVGEDNVIITANIPIDPIGVTEKPRRIARERALRMARVVISYLGVAASLVAVYISPVWQTWLLLGVQVVVGLLFVRLSHPLKIRGWGIVYDESGKKPLGNVVARLFNSQFNKLVASQVTDSRGRYYLMAADDVYFATFDKPKYEPVKVEGIDMRGKDGGVVSVDVKMRSI
ncbi:MAG TPA: hypothetical protein PLV72_03310 [Candidatus Magasanikbacteria bacterium]|nr:hypothetical protein [Candidatus Magasanikbacteria bacterium]